MPLVRSDADVEPAAAQAPSPRRNVEADAVPVAESFATVTADDAIFAVVTLPSVGVRASDSRESFPAQTVSLVVPRVT